MMAIIWLIFWEILIWLVVEPYPAEKYEFVSWDDDIPYIFKNKKMFQTTNQGYKYTKKSGAAILSYIYITCVNK